MEGLGRVDVIVDGQFGSTGKGLIADYLRTKRNYSFVISNTTRNASHTVLLPNGEPYKFVHLPIAGVFNPDADIIITGDATIDLEQLFREIEDFDSMYDIKSRLYIHPNASVITKDDIELEKRECRKIASTMTGTAGAKIRKILRNGSATLAKDIPELSPFIADIYAIIHGHLSWGRNGLVEGSQGFDLSINHGGVYGDQLGFYPYTTSRNVDPSSFLGACGISPRLVGDIIGIVRTFPIRVGDGSNNKVDGLTGVSLEGTSSGGYYSDQEELTWESVTKISGCSEPIREYTSLTKRLRRVFSFRISQWKHFTRVCAPSIVFITFANYLDCNIYGKRGMITLSTLKYRYPKIYNFVTKLMDEQYWVATPLQIREWYLSTSPRSHDIMKIELK